MVSRSVASIAVLWMLAPGCSDSGASSDLGRLTSPIVGGQPAPACAFPTVAQYRSDLEVCGATLIHPELIVLAAHCLHGGESWREVSFGDSGYAADARKTVAVSSCEARGGLDVGEDFAFCTLAEPITELTPAIVPAASGCEANFVQPGEQVTLVGYGFIAATDPGKAEKRWVNARVNAVQDANMLIGDDRVGPCFGDSGGPAFLELPDGTWRLVGVASTGTGAACRSQSSYALIAGYVPWIEGRSGLDVTPCYDQAGQWQPSAECTTLPVHPELGSGTWTTLCSDRLERTVAQQNCDRPASSPEASSSCAVAHGAPRSSPPSAVLAAALVALLLGARRRSARR